MARPTKVKLQDCMLIIRTKDGAKFKIGGPGKHICIIRESINRTRRSKFRFIETAKCNNGHYVFSKALQRYPKFEGISPVRINNHFYWILQYKDSAITDDDIESITVVSDSQVLPMLL